MNDSLNAAAVSAGCPARPSVCRRVGFAQTWLRFDLVGALLSAIALLEVEDRLSLLCISCQWLSGRILFECLDIISDEQWICYGYYGPFRP